ncbi:hypothetical protein AAC387_Pa12g1690 [Persea americana]
MLDPSSNKITGSLPPEIGQLTRLGVLDISSNNLFLDLSHNFLTGEIPPQLGSLQWLEELNISHNKLCGSSPSSVERDSDIIGFAIQSIGGSSSKWHSHRARFTRSFSEQQGFIRGNSLFAHALENFTKREADETRSGEVVVFSVLNHNGSDLYNAIIRATEDFDGKYCIGEGGYGKVYKAELLTGQVLAIKKLYSFEEGDAAASQEAFRNEIQMLTEIPHRNIVRLHGFCFHMLHKFLIYEFIERGSLASFLRSNEGAVELVWVKRNVIKGVAHALSYMHHDCSPPIVHRDISTNNILIKLELRSLCL